MAHTFTNLLTHVIFSTKDRMPCIDAELKPELLAYVGRMVREVGGKAYAINGTADHVHLLISLPPAIALSDTMRAVKANSSRWVSEKWLARKSFGWQTG
jgi:REP element-mobilizing transposase RayT